MAPLEELEQAYLEACDDPAFQAELNDVLDWGTAYINTKEGIIYT